MSLNRKVEQLEHLLNQGGACPHLPPIVKYFETDGTLDTAHGIPDETPCACGQERLEIRVQYVDMTLDKLEAMA